MVGSLLVNPIARADPFAVTTTANSGTGSLRDAITAANGNAGLDTIRFKIGSGSQTITPLTSLPTIADPVVIDGTTQPGYSGRPLIVLDGATAGGTGLLVTTSGTTVQGLDVIDWATGLALSGASNVRITGNFIGTDISGATAAANGTGIKITGGSSDNVIGGKLLKSSGKGNVISGNTGSGISIDGSATTNNRVMSNLIGTDRTGTVDLGNGSDGVLITDTGSGPARGNVVGGATRAARNVISGNAAYGVNILGAGVDNNQVTGNFIGTDIKGTTSVENNVGIEVCQCSTGGTADTGGNVIGGTNRGAGNLISGNASDGIYLCGCSGAGDGGVTRTRVEGNRIGTKRNGRAPLGNGGYGIDLIGAGSTGGGVFDNTFGGTVAAARNVISANDSGGMFVCGCDGGGGGTNRNVVEGNYIGTDRTGQKDLGNGFTGITICGCSGGAVDGGAAHNRIGGTTPGARNVISGNGGAGVDMCGCAGDPDGALHNVVQGNYIGITADGRKALGNDDGGFCSGTGAGVLIGGCGGGGPDAGAIGNIIGGVGPGARNFIAGNNGAGIEIVGNGGAGGGSEGTRVLGNSIGVGPRGNKLGNTGDGVFVDGGLGISGDDQIGGTGAGEGNIIANNGGDGVQVDGTTGPTDNDPIRHNSIYANGSGIGILLTAGGNGSQSPPVITSVTSGGGATTIAGTIVAGTYRIEVFVNPSCADPEGKSYRGAVSAGAGTWSLTVPTIPSGRGVTATATDSSTFNTSPFSACTTA